MGDVCTVFLELEGACFHIPLIRDCCELLDTLAVMFGIRNVFYYPISHKHQLKICSINLARSRPVRHFPDVTLASIHRNLFWNIADNIIAGWKCQDA